MIVALIEPTATSAYTLNNAINRVRKGDSPFVGEGARYFAKALSLLNQIKIIDLPTKGTVVAFIGVQARLELIIGRYGEWGKPKSPEVIAAITLERDALMDYFEQLRDEAIRMGAKPNSSGLEHPWEEADLGKPKHDRSLKSQVRQLFSLSKRGR